MTARLFVATWFAGLPGVFAVALLLLPEVAAMHPLPVSLAMAQFASIAQGAIVLALAAFCGAVLSGRVGLRAPVLSALLDHKPVAAALRFQIVPGIWGGLAGAVLLWGVSQFEATVLPRVDAGVRIPIAVRLLYGGIAEEILIRWGLMTFALWCYWRVFERGAGRPSATAGAVSIAVSALLFGVGHLPAATLLFGPLSAYLVSFIVLANAAFGVVAGWLYWRRGLEAAVLAHVLAHALFVVVGP